MPQAHKSLLVQDSSSQQPGLTPAAALLLAHALLQEARLKLDEPSTRVPCIPDLIFRDCCSLGWLMYRACMLATSAQSSSQAAAVWDHTELESGTAIVINDCQYAAAGAGSVSRHQACISGPGGCLTWPLPDACLLVWQTQPRQQHTGSHTNAY